MILSLKGKRLDEISAFLFVNCGGWILRSVLLSVQNIIKLIIPAGHPLGSNNFLSSAFKPERNREGDEQMRKQRKVSVQMKFTLYFLGVRESHFLYRPVKVFFRYIDVEKV